jgi:hypothetical protein
MKFVPFYIQAKITITNHKSKKTTNLYGLRLCGGADNVIRTRDLILTKEIRHILRTTANVNKWRRYAV